MIGNVWVSSTSYPAYLEVQHFTYVVPVSNYELNLDSFETSILIRSEEEVP